MTFDIKEQFTSQPLVPSRCYYCELPGFEDTECSDICLLFNIVELDGTCLVMLKVPKKLRQV